MAYALAALVTTALVISGLALNRYFHVGAWFALPVLAIPVIAYFFSLGPALLASFITILAFRYFIIDPVGSFSLTSGFQLTALTLLAFVCAGNAIFGTYMRSRRKYLEYSKRSLESLADGFSGAILWEIDMATDRYSYVSPNTQPLLGQDRNTWPDQRASWMDSIHPEDRETVLSKLQLARLTHEIQHCEHRGLTSEGRTRWFSTFFRQSSETDSNRKLRCLSADITALKEQEAILLKSERRFRRMYESNMIGIAFSDLDGTVHEANGAFCELTDYTPEDITASTVNVHSLIAREYSASAEISIQELRYRGVCRAIEVDYLRKNESHVPVLIGSAVLTQMKTQEMVTFVLNLTERKQVEESLRQSEERFRLLVDGVKDYGIYLVDPHGRIISWNEGAERIIGYTADEVVGQSINRFYHPDEVAAGKPENDLRAAATHGRHEDEGWRVHKNGNRFWANVVVTALYDERGQLRGYGNVTRNLTERKRAEDFQRFIGDASRLLSESLDYQTTMKKLSKLIVPRMADWCVVDVIDHNRLQRVAIAHADPTKGDWAREVQQRYAPDLQGQTGPAGVIRTSEPVLVSEISDSLLTAVENEYLRMLRGLGLTSYMCVPLRARGRTLGAITFITAESGRRFWKPDLELALEVGGRAGLAVDNAMLYSEVEKSLRMREELIAIVSHDLKNPLSAIGMSAKLVQERLKSKKEILKDELVYNNIELIGQATDRMERMIHDLLDFARVQAGRLVVTAKETDADSLITEMVEMFKPIVAKKNIRLEKQSKIKNRFVMADRERILQVLSNLIGNAVKFSPEGSHVVIGADLYGDNLVRFFVRDNGPGIPEDKQAYIFDRFWQATHAAGRLGAGLGLSISKGIIEAHGGTIWMESKVGAGTTFYFTLPVAVEAKVEQRKAA